MLRVVAACRFGWITAVLGIGALVHSACRGDQEHGAPGAGAQVLDSESGSAVDTDAFPAVDGAAGQVEAHESSSDRAHLPDAGSGDESEPPRDAGASAHRCPKDMVDVAGRFCIDRYENTLVDDRSGQSLSPHYPPQPGVPLRMFEKWQSERSTIGPEKMRALPLPNLPEVERSTEFVPRAVSRRGVLPQGYVSGKMANAACARAGKRLCSIDEWRYACRGQRQTKFPYGDTYVRGLCNVDREQHPAALLHGNASIGHSDPRLGVVAGNDGPLLRKTGATPKCVSRWGRDAIHDMVGNVDEWIDDPAGTFVGGFFSRNTQEGCDSTIRTHGYEYWDYSLGIRCCRSLP